MSVMRILVLNYEYPPLGSGGGIVTKEIVEGLSTQYDCIIDVVTMGMGDLPLYEQVNSKLAIHRVRSWRSRKDICHPWEQLTYLVSAYCKVRQLLKQHTYALCHVHFIIPTGPLALLLKRIYNIPYVVTAHGSDVLGYNKRFRYLYPFLVQPWRRVLDGAHAITAPSQFLLEEIKKHHRSVSEKMRVVRNGIAVAKFTPLPKQPYFLYVGRLVEAKGVQDIIATLATLELGSWRFKIVGTGPYQAELMQQVAAAGLRDRVDFLGRVPNDSELMRKLYGEAKVFVLASWFENMSISLLEAKQAGCHIVASRVGGNPEIVSADSLFTVRDRADLCRVMCDKMREVDIPAASTIYDWPVVLPDYAKVITGVV